MMSLTALKQEPSVLQYRGKKSMETGAVLIADDNEPMRALLTAALSKHGYSVQAFGDGEAAIAAAVTGEFDLMLLDLLMPGLGGMELLRRLRQQFSPMQLPIIMLTGVDDKSAILTALEAGANDYVTKPFDLSIVLARVRTHMMVRRQSIALQEVGKRLAMEVAAAARMQKASLPLQDPRFGPFQFAWRYESCDQLSGDGLNIIPVSATQIAFYILDVTGHGVQAALLSAAVSRLLLPATGESAIVSEPTSLLNRDVLNLLAPAATAVRPSVVVTRLARRFREHPAEGQYFSLFYGLLDLKESRIIYASAGHPAPIIQPAEGPTRPLDLGGLMIGVDAEESYRDHLVELAPGDRFLVHSDGVTEAKSPAGELFGDRRLMKLLAEAKGDLASTLATIIEASSRWSSGITSDDRTLLVVERDANCK